MIHYMVDTLLSSTTFSIHWKSNSDECAKWAQALYCNSFGLFYLLSECSPFVFTMKNYRSLYFSWKYSIEYLLIG